MNMKEKLNKLLRKEEEQLLLNLKTLLEKRKNYVSGHKNISLDTKIDNFINWYYKNMVKENYTDIGKFHKPYDMRNFIEKMAVWYELRYPNYEINRLMFGSDQEEIEFNNATFNSNKYVSDLFDEKADIRELDRYEFHNFKALLSGNEDYLLSKARYRDLVYIEPHRRSAHLHLTSKGFVEESEGFESYTNHKVNDNELKGMHIKDVVQLLKDKDVSLPKDNELEETIKDVDKWNYQNEEMLNCVMYRIIERGGNRIGPRRAFLFAKEFGRNIDIPMMYGVDYSDPGLRRFINEYIKAGGSKDLVCYVGYFSRASKNEKMSTVSVQEMIKTIYDNCVTKYTPEETELHQRMVNVLASRIPKDEIRKKRTKIIKFTKEIK